MKDSCSLNDILDEAVKIMKDYPHLKYYEALEKSKEVLGFKGVNEIDNRRSNKPTAEY